jgi:hypothetical protein
MLLRFCTCGVGWRIVIKVTGEPESLTWNAESVAALMLQHHIRSRAALAKKLGMTRNSVNRTFDENWHGEANARLIARMAAHFGVPMSRLVVEPAVVIKRVNNRQVERISDRQTQ